MNERYSIDIYRTDDAIFIHDGPGGWKRGRFGLLLSLFPVFMALLCVVLAQFDPPQAAGVREANAEFPLSIGATILTALGLIFILLPGAGFMIYCFVYIFFFSLWRIVGHETILIDRNSIRHDWWFFGMRGSRIYPRNEILRAETEMGSSITGGKAGVKIHVGKRPRWFGTRKIYIYLPDWGERRWLLEEIERFQNEVPQKEVPANEPTAEFRSVQKGSFLDAESGPNVLESLDWQGKRFERVVPKVESVPSMESPERITPGILPLRCGQCHQIVPRDHVLPDRPIAHCPDCGFVFEPWELKRDETRCSRRTSVRRDADSLEIVQKPLRTGLPLWTILSFILFDLAVLGFFLYMRQLDPEINPLSLFRAAGNPEISVGGRMVFAFVMLHVLLLPLPLWAFFDRRTIRLDREKLEISVRWLFFRWKKTVPRRRVKKATFGVRDFMFYNVKLLYDETFLRIGGSKPEDVETLCTETNHFLYTVEPGPDDTKYDEISGADIPLIPKIVNFTHDTSDQRERVDTHGSEAPVAYPCYGFLGGTDSFSTAIGLHCPDCGVSLTGNLLDFPGDSANCPDCEKSFSLKNATAYRIDPVVNTVEDEIVYEQNEDRLVIRYAPKMSKGMKYFNLAGFYTCILMFAGMFFGLIFMLFQEGKMQGLGLLLFATIFFVPMGLMLVYIYFMLAQEKNAMYCDWTIELDEKEIRLDLRCKKRSKTIRIDRNRVVEACPNRSTNVLQPVRFGYFPDFLESRRHNGSHLLLDDGSRQFLPLGTLDVRKMRDSGKRLRAAINEFLARHPVRKRKDGLQQSGG